MLLKPTVIDIDLLYVNKLFKQQKINYLGLDKYQYSVVDNHLHFPQKLYEV